MSIHINNVTKKYGNVRVLDSITFEIPQNTITAIVGKNGSGKTTLIKCLSTLLIFDSGKISILGESVEQKNFNIIRNTISVCLNEGKNLYLNLTLIQNIEYFLEINNNSFNDNAEEIDHLLEIFRINEYRNVIVAKMSSGNKQKINLIIALIKNASVLILDEPNSGLDIESLNTLKIILKEQKKEKTIIITSHDLNLIEDISDEIVIISNGQLKYKGTINDLYYNQIFIETDKNISEKVLNAMKQFGEISYCGDNKFHITTNKSNLDSIFKILINNRYIIEDFKINNISQEILRYLS